jgi:hypothetical protein
VAGEIDLRGLTPSAALALTVLFELSLIAISLSRATAELYHLRRPEAHFEAMPVGLATHLHAALLMRLGRSAIVAVAILAIISRFGGGGHDRLGAWPPLIMFAVLMTLAEMLGALNWIHWGHKREKLPALEAAVTLLLTTVLAGLMLLDVMSVSRPRGGAFWLLSSGSAAMLYLAVRISHERWRGSDIEYAGRLQQRGRGGALLIRVLTSRFGPIVRSQLARDLQLTLRGFSSAVYVASAFAVLWPAVLIAVLTADLLPHATGDIAWLDATWLPEVMAIKIASVLAIASMAALMPVLLAYQLPHFWLERAAGTAGLDMWQTKLWYARLVSAPGPLMVWTAGMLSGKTPMFYAVPLLAECLWLWWLSSSIMGALSFEIPGRAGLGVILAVMAGLTAGVVGSMAWPVGLLLYVQTMHSLTERGRARARYYLMMGED